MATINLSVKYRPLRIGFLVRDGNVEDVVKAAGLNSFLWGGVHNPIIPVSADGTFARRLIDYFNIDVLFAVAHSPEIDKLIGEHPFLRSRHFHEVDSLTHEDWPSKKHQLAYLDSLNLVDLYWERDFKNSKDSSKSNCTFIRWQSGDPLARLFAIQYGHYPDGYNLLHNFEKGFVVGLRAKEIEIPNGAEVESICATGITPIVLTGGELVGYGGGWHSEDGVYFGDQDNFDDLVCFWNLRAAGSDLQFVPAAHAERFTKLVTAHLGRLSNRPTRNPNLEAWDSICVHFQPGHETQAQEFVKRYQTKKRMTLSRLHDVRRYGFGGRAATYHFDWDKALATVEESFGKPVVTLSLPSKKFLTESQRDRRLEVDSQGLAVSLDFYTESSHPGHTLKPPYIRSLNEFYSREMAGDPWALRIEREGIALITDAGDHSVTLYPLGHQALVERIFELAGIKAKLSQPGLLASQIIQNMREFSPLEACRVFKIRGVRKLLTDVSAADLIGWTEALQTIGSQSFTKFKKLFIESRKKPELSPADVITFLLKKQILRPHLRLWERVSRRRTVFRCVQCGLESKIRMQCFEGKWQCPFCGKEIYLPEFIDSKFRKKTMWTLKKAGLFSKDNNQEGAIPVILSLLSLLRRFDFGRFLYSTSLDLALDAKCETDLCVVQYRRGDEIEIGIGECKSDKGHITPQDIVNLKAVREKLDAANLSCYMIFAKTSESFYEDEIALFRQLKADGVRFILFTNRELEPYDQYLEPGNEHLPVRHPFTLADMARNSDFVYLQGSLASPPTAAQPRML